MKSKENKNGEKAFANISIRSFITVVIILVVVLLMSGALSYFIPQGNFKIAIDEDGREVIVPGTYTQGEVGGIEFWRVITAPVRVFDPTVSDPGLAKDALLVILISAFLLIMSGVFNVLDKTNGIKVFIGRLMHKLKNKGGPVVCLSVLVFMIFGSFFGMFEELSTLLPIMVVFMLSMGFDSMTGVGVCLLAACFGFSAAITNPFSVGTAAEVAGVDIFDGVWIRIIFFALIYVTLCTFLMLHIRKIEKNPKLSPTYELDVEKRKNLASFYLNYDAKEKKIFRVYSVFFIIQAVVLVLIAAVPFLTDYAIPMLAASFLIAGLVCGVIVADRKRDTFACFFKGAAAMLPAVLMIALASSVKLVMTESNIIHSVMNGIIKILDGRTKFGCVILIYFMILILQIFINSASAKIILVMPIIMPVCIALGINPAIVILAYCMADGFTDVIMPTNPVLLVGLSMANVSYSQWFKWTWKLQLFVFALSIGVLGLATAVM